MNSSIAAASLLGFGDKSASVAFQEFGVTLGKIYDVQEKQAKAEANSRKSVTEEYNKSQRDKKRSDSDLVNMLKGLNKTGPTRRKSGAKKKGTMGLMSKILLGAGAVLVGKALYDAVSTKVFDSVKDTVEDMVDPIMDAFMSVFQPIKDFFNRGNEDEDESGNNNESSENNQQTSDQSSSGNSNGKATFTLIGEGEGGYNSVNRGRAGDTPGGAKSVTGKNLTDMSVKEIVAAQQSEELFAVGKYQIIPDTMTGFLQTMGISEDDKFDQVTQEKFTSYVLKYKRPAVGDYLSGKSNNRSEAIQALSREFAAVGLAYAEAGRRRGQSRYAGKSGNKASISPEEMGRALDKDRQKLAKGGKVKKKRKRKGNGPKSENTIDQIKPLKRQKGGKIFLHWAATKYSGASPNYHATIQGDGSVSKTRDYNTFGGGHTYRQNDEGIGISLAAMAGATTNNFGQYPVKEIQYKNMAKLCAQILTNWGHGPSYVNDRTVPTHAEAGRDLPGDNYGPVAWGGDGSRWDLWKLYQNDANGSGGPKIRNMIKGYMSSSNNIELESEDAPSYVESPSDSAPGVPGMPSPGATPGGVNPSSPPLPPPPKTFDQAVEQLAAQALAPLFSSLLGSVSAVSGNPLPSGTDQPTITSPGAAGAVSINDPSGRALLNAIADAEGTSGRPNNGYNTMFTGKQFTSLTDHPRAIQSSNGLRSDAAGRYQFLSTTWDSYANGRDMSPANQDAVALDLVAKKQGVDISDGLSKQEVYKLGREWASIEGGPQGVPGGSYGSQAKYSADRFLEMYKAYGGEVQGLQKGGMVGGQINMRGTQNAHMSKLREAQQRMKRKGPKVIQVTLPPMPAKQPSAGGGDGESPIMHEMKMSQLADFNRRLAMGALT